MKNILFLFIFISSISSCVVNSPDKINPDLVKKIKSDTRFTVIKEKSEDLIRSGLTAGGSYVEVWIRDLNTFIETACYVDDKEPIREALLNFFRFQGEDGNIPDGYTNKNVSSISYEFIHSDLVPELEAHKNTVETDQESSLIQSVTKYIAATGDRSILKEIIAGRTVEQRMEDALNYLLNNRYSEKYGLLWGATTSDWGDVQPEHEWGVYLDSLSHLSIDIYDNAMFVVAIDCYIGLIDDKEKKDHWHKVVTDIKNNISGHLWDNSKQKFIPHIYLYGSPFPADFDENIIHYHGGTAIAIEAGLLDKNKIEAVYNQMVRNVKSAGAQSIGLTVYPAYPDGFFKNSWMGAYDYQNGGDWTWFGGRMVQQLIKNGFYEEAYESLSPMLDRVIKHDGFFEYWTLSGEPKGSNKFRGSAGVLWKAITMFEDIIANSDR